MDLFVGKKRMGFAAFLQFCEAAVELLL
eukprot:COSAG04_NODE_12479_length_650_cov_44.328494_1_plen_27_part_10